MKLPGAVAVVVTAVLGLAAAQGSYLPQVDLGYGIQEALAYNDTGRYYNFSNIRYAQAPVGDLRFARPVPPAGRDTTVQNGNRSVICPQATPAWQLIGLQFSQAFSNGSLGSWDYARAREIAIAQLSSLQNSSMPDTRQTEDCLFLDVMVPKAAFDKRNQTARGNGTGAPVIIWIYGGGYTLGSKTSQGNPAGLIAASMSNGTFAGDVSGSNSTDGAIFVAMNYRLGALGWLAGPSFQFDGGVSNAALYDQRLAIQWVRERIHLFGGDPNRITLMGESAGGGSIMHQITAYGGCKGVNFQRAIMQSPGWFPISDQWTQENTTNNFFQLLNVSSVAEARMANTSAIMRANALQVAASRYGTFTYGPVVDGIFVPAQPGMLLGTGQFAKDVKVMMGHNTNEGVFFAPSYVANESDFSYWMSTQYPSAAPAVIQHMEQVLYPPQYDGRHNYTTPLTRAIKMISEQIFTCNTDYLARAHNNQTYNYQFEVAPALHGYDIPYTFYNGAPNVNVPVAQTLQGYLTRFAATGNPNAAYLPPFPMQGMNSSQVGMNVTGIQIQKDPTANDRCRWLQKYLYT